MTKPLRSLSNGRDAFSGSSLNLSVRACMPAKLLMEYSVMPLSEPPARHTSRRPDRMESRATPMASVPEAQAVHTVWARPVIPRAMETLAQASLGISSGIASGDTLRLPPSIYLLYVSSSTSIPERPFPATIPVVSSASCSRLRPASLTASLAAPTKNWVKRDFYGAIGGVKKGYGGDTALSQLDGLPHVGYILSDGSYGTDAGNDDSSLAHGIPFFCAQR